jgi:hypothetical protein
MFIKNFLMAPAAHLQNIFLLHSLEGIHPSLKGNCPPGFRSGNCLHV